MRFDALLYPAPEGCIARSEQFYVDPVRPVERALITHGHSDHARSGHAHVLATRQTLDIMRIRYGEDFCGSSRRPPSARRYDVNGVKVSFHPAGHVLGSAQIAIEKDACASSCRAITSAARTRPAPPTSRSLRCLHHRGDLRPAGFPSS
jgi:putative mRNA 3-end processing factor